jgi:dihydrofolate synthase / folylpolyglutamate synthase
VSLRAANVALPDVTLALRGRHQVGNAVVTFCLLSELMNLGEPLDAASLRAGLSGAHWPGRLERTEWQGASVILDAAHNPAGARALADFLRDIGWTSVTLIAGVMRDKDVAGVLTPLLPCCSRIVCTTPPSPRALAADALAALAASLPSAPQEVAVVPDPAAALAGACKPGARVVAAGSIFLLGPLRGILR